MKKLLSPLLIPFLLIGAAIAQSVPERALVTFLFDHDTRYAARLYTNGVLFQAFSLSEVTPMTTNTFRVVSKAFPRGQYAVTLTVVDAEGLESDPSNALTIQVKPGGPRNLRL